MKREEAYGLWATIGYASTGLSGLSEWIICALIGN